MTNQARTIQILLAEDNEGDAILTEERFMDSGIDIDLHLASDGEIALNFLQKKHEFADAPTPDLVLLDINMPKRNGLEILRKLKQDPQLAAIPIFILTGSKRNKEVDAAKLIGANGFIVKGTDYALQNLIDYAYNAKHDPSTWVQLT